MIIIIDYQYIAQYSIHKLVWNFDGTLIGKF